MEKRKLLLVAVSVGVFLVIVLSAAILIFTPGGGGLAITRPIPAGESPSGAAPRPPASADAADMVRNTEDLQDLRVPPPSAAPSGSDSTSSSGASASPSASAVQENNIYFNAENSTQVPAGRSDDNTQVVINVPKPSAPGVPAPGPRPPAGAPAPAPASRAPSASPAPPAASGTRGTSGGASRAPSAPASTPAKPAAAAGDTGAARVPGPQANTAVSTASGAQAGTASGAQTNAAASTASGAQANTASGAQANTAVSTAPGAQVGVSIVAKPSTPASPPRSRPQQDYWIQTGAFSALVRAEDAKEILASKGLVSIIDDREVGGQTWYRVRIGPYTSENEANYWLALVRAIDGFDQSQVRSNQR